MKTAVEWLCEQLEWDDSKIARVIGLKKYNQVVSQAKEMEKEQMRNASCPYIGGWEEGEFEYWYNEKFKK
jgi:uncharacterized protein YmfQ (DUF2313 family)